MNTTRDMDRKEQMNSSETIGAFRWYLFTVRLAALALLFVMLVAPTTAYPAHADRDPNSLPSAWREVQAEPDPPPPAAPNRVADPDPPPPMR